MGKKKYQPALDFSKYAINMILHQISRDFGHFWGELLITSIACAVNNEFYSNNANCDQLFRAFHANNFQTPIFFS